MTSNAAWNGARPVLRAFGLLIAGIGLLTACGDSDDDSPGAGAACVNGDECGSGLYCLIKGPEQTGACTQLPAVCGKQGDCDPMTECGNAMMEACSTGSSCVGVMGKYVVSCTQSQGNTRKEGESCSQLAGCEGGLVCVIPASANEGICNPLPSACGGKASCSGGCLDSTCTGGYDSCMSSGDRALVVCN